MSDSGEIEVARKKRLLGGGGSIAQFSMRGGGMDDDSHVNRPLLTAILNSDI